MTMEMTSRERVNATLRREEPDRLPIDFGSTHNSSVSIVAYNRLKKHLGIKSRSYMRDPIPMLVSPDLDDGLEILKKMGSDTLPLTRYYNNGMPATDWKKWLLKDGSECMVPGQFNPVENKKGDLELALFNGLANFRMPKDGYYFDKVNSPLGFIENRQQLEEVLPFLRESGIFHIREEELEIIRNKAKHLHEETDYALVASGGPLFFSLYQIGQELFGYEKFFILMASKPEFVHCWMEFLTTSLEEKLTKYLKMMDKYIDVIMMGDDFGTQVGPQISPKMFGELFKPYMARICKLIHEISPNVKILLHSCGSVAPFIPDFIEIGIDALNPVQTTAKNMDPVMLKREFGKHITFWGGGVRTQTTLVNGTVEDIKQEVKEMLDIFKPGGGYVFCPIHDLQEHVSPEKILAIYETAQLYGKY